MWVTSELTLVFLFEQGIDIALSKLKQGDWVHIFPEGSRSRDGGKSIGTVRRGIGRLVICLHYFFGYKPCFPLAQRFWFVVLRYIEDKNHETNKDRRGSTSWVATRSFYEN